MRGIVVTLVFCSVIAVTLAGCGAKVDTSNGNAVVQSADPRLSYPTPYRNVRPDVKYVGDDACGQCHPAVAESYHKHPMGRSLAPMTVRAAEERYDAAAHNPFTDPASGFDFL